MASGFFYARCNAGDIEVQSFTGKYVWHDEIDANSFEEISRKDMENLIKKGDMPSFYGEIARALEGSWDLGAESISRTNFKVQISGSVFYQGDRFTRSGLEAIIEYANKK
ncbi:hypothetical protein SDC9_133791 [bioreactor metagenome]|uniref:Uncharacterized protein n=1 Tax=bioreactor metagenome TaxID=1076179 RepID=A0A645DB75_9ZZZZ